MSNFSSSRVKRAKEHSEAAAVREWSELLDGHPHIGLGRNESKLWGQPKVISAPRLAHAAQVAFNFLIFILACIFADTPPIATLLSLSVFKAAVHHPFYPFSSVSARIVGPRRGHLGLLAGEAQRGHTGAAVIINYPLSWIFTKICKFQEEKEEICTEATDRGCECL